MQTALLPIMRDYLVRFQQTAIKETGRRPLCWLRSPKDEALVIPGCRRPGYAFWQPISWKDDQAPLGERMTVSAPPEENFQEALAYAAERPELPLSFCMAATCDEGEKLLLMLRAEDGEAYIVPADQNREPVYLNATLERLLPRVQFVYDI